MRRLSRACAPDAPLVRSVRGEPGILWGPTSMRPHKFPMDMVMFTGVVEEDEYHAERPLEVARLRASGEMDRHAAPAPRPQLVRRARVAGATAIAVGLTLFLLIVVAALSH